MDPKSIPDGIDQEAAPTLPEEAVEGPATEGALALKTADQAVTREQRRSRRKREVRARTISVKRMTKRELELGRMLYPDVEDVEKPQSARRVRQRRAALPVRVVQASPLPRRRAPRRAPSSSTSPTSKSGR